MCMLSNGFPVFNECAFNLSTSCMINASLPALVRGVNLFLCVVMCQFGREDTPSVSRIFCSTRL